MTRLAVVATAVLGSGVGHLIAGRDRAAAAWIGASSLALAGAALWPALLLVGFGMRAPCAVELWWSARRSTGDRTTRSPLVGATVGVLAKVAVAGLLWLGWMDTYRISSGSMEPSLEIGDQIVAFKGAFWLGEPAVGDIVVFETPCHPGRVYVKRVVATAGDRVELRCGTLYLNDGELTSIETGPTRARESARGASWMVTRNQRGADRRFDFPVREMFAPCDGAAPPGELVASRGGPPSCPRQRQLVVPTGHVFVLGDNRENSQDSRIWGPVALDHIHARVTGVWVPAGGRWRRFGTAK